MSRERYRRPERWDSERFAIERERDLSRYGGERERFVEEREPRFVRERIALRPRERSVDEIYERRGPRGYEEDEYRKRVYYDEPEERHTPLRSGREPRRRGESIEINIQRGRDSSPSPPPRAPKPILVRRQSSLDTFDRKPFSPPWREREEYGPPARIYRREREDYRPPVYAPVPLPRTRALLPPRRYEREIEVAEPDYYGDDAYRPYPERVREREIYRTRRRSPSQDHSKRASSVSSKSSSSSSASEAPKSEFPKRGKTRMPARLVSKKAIIELGYPFEEEGETIIIQKALGRENIDEVIRLSEEFKSETKTVYRIEGAEMSGGRSNDGDAVEEKKIEEIKEVIEVPAPPPPKAPSPEPQGEIIEEHIKTTTIEHRDVSPPGAYHHYHESGPMVVHKDKHVEIVTGRDTRAISAEIRALEAEKEALRAEKREIRRAEKLRREGRESGELVLFEERVIRDPEPSGGVRIERDRKGRMAISVPKKYR